MKIPWFRYLWIAVEVYTFYIGLVAGYAAVRGECIGIWFSGRKEFMGYMPKSLYPAAVWPRRC